MKLFIRNYWATLLTVLLALGYLNGRLSADETPVCDATDWKARAEWLEGVVTQLQAEVSGALQLYNAQQQLTGLAAKEPPKPHPAQPDKP